MVTIGTLDKDDVTVIIIQESKQLARKWTVCQSIYH